jgi:hypothetical protein
MVERRVRPAHWKKVSRVDAADRGDLEETDPCHAVAEDEREGPSRLTAKTEAKLVASAADVGRAFAMSWNRPPC